MVKPFGHLAMGLLWAIPAWFLWDGRVSLAFVAFTVSSTLLPDVDYYLAQWMQGVHHHGVMHTVLFVAIVAVIAGWVGTILFDRVVKRWWARAEEGWLSEREVYAFVAGGLLLGGLAHLFADLLSAPDGSQRLEPFWPFLDKPISVDVIYYADPKWNVGLLAAAVAIHLALAFFDAGPTWFAGPTDATR